jgi:DNA-binding MarR family transcriptional regulator
MCLYKDVKHDAEPVEELLGRLAELLTRWVRRAPTEADLSFPAAATIVRLTLEGPYRLTDLAAAEGVSQPGMTQLVTRLESDGLVRRTPAAGDRRVVLVEATAEGAALVDRRRRQRSEQLRRLLETLTTAERDSIEAALPALLRLAEAGVAALPASRAAPAPAPAPAPLRPTAPPTTSSSRSSS